MQLYAFTGIGLIVLGGLVDGFGSAVSMEGFRERGCAGFPKVKEMYAKSVDKMMCSKLCHCDEGADKANLKLWDGQTSEKLKEFNRLSSETKMSS